MKLARAPRCTTTAGTRNIQRSVTRSTAQIRTQVSQTRQAHSSSNTASFRKLQSKQTTLLFRNSAKEIQVRYETLTKAKRASRKKVTSEEKEKEKKEGEEGEEVEKKEEIVPTRKSKKAKEEAPAEPPPPEPILELTPGSRIDPKTWPKFRSWDSTHYAALNVSETAATSLEAFHSAFAQQPLSEEPETKLTAMDTTAEFLCNILDNEQKTYAMRQKPLELPVGSKTARDYVDCIVCDSDTDKHLMIIFERKNEAKWEDEKIGMVGASLAFCHKNHKLRTEPEPYEPPDTTWKSMWTEEKEGGSDTPQPQLQRAVKIEPQPARDQEAFFVAVRQKKLSLGHLYLPLAALKAITEGLYPTTQPKFTWYDTNLNLEDPEQKKEAFRLVVKLRDFVRSDKVLVG